MRKSMLLGVLAASIGLSSCNETSRPVAAAPPQAMAGGPSLAGLPAGAACSQAIDAYQAVIQHDNETGNVNDSVYHQIEGEISRAASACSAGRDGEARSMIAASKERHGYHM